MFVLCSITPSHTPHHLHIITSHTPSHTPHCLHIITSHTPSHITSPHIPHHHISTHTSHHHISTHLHTSHLHMHLHIITSPHTFTHHIFTHHIFTHTFTSSHLHTPSPSHHHITHLHITHLYIITFPHTFTSHTPSHITSHTPSHHHISTHLHIITSPHTPSHHHISTHTFTSSHLHTPSHHHISTHTIRILKDNSKGSKAAGVLNATVVAFFKEASAVIQETTSGLLGHRDMTPASVYCLHALLPILTHFLKHLQEHNMTEDVISKCFITVSLLFHYCFITADMFGLPICACVYACLCGMYVCVCGFIEGDVVQHCQAMFESLWSVAKKGTLQHTTR